MSIRGRSDGRSVTSEASQHIWLPSTTWPGIRLRFQTSRRPSKKMCRMNIVDLIAESGLESKSLHWEAGSAWPARPSSPQRLDPGNLGFNFIWRVTGERRGSCGGIMVVEYYFTQDSVLVDPFFSLFPLPQTARAALRYPRRSLLRNDSALLIDYLCPTLQVWCHTGRVKATGNACPLHQVARPCCKRSRAVCAPPTTWTQDGDHRGKDHGSLSELGWGTARITTL